MAHPTLSGLIIDFFYSGPSSVGQQFPEVFVTEVPRVTVAVSATAVLSVSVYILLTLLTILRLKVVLDEMASSQGKVAFRVAAYMPVYLEILGLMKKCDTSPTHAMKTRLLQIEWARIGRCGIMLKSNDFHFVDLLI